MNLRIIVLLIAASTLHAAEDPIRESRRLQGEARQAYAAKDFRLFLDRVRASSALRPSHPTLLYYVAGGLALNGLHDEALDALARLAAMGMVYAPEKEPDFAPLAQSPRFAEVVAAFNRNRAPSGARAVAGRLDAPGIIPEGLARDDRRGFFYLSSVRKGEIWRIAGGGATRIVENYPLGIFGLAYDAKRNVLWAAAAGLEHRQGLAAADRGRSALLEIDAGSGKILRELPAPGEGRHLLGDVAISPSGEVLTTDSASQQIYRLAADGLEPFVQGPFVSLQGLTWSPDGRSLYVADYSHGLFRIEGGTAHLLEVPSTVSLLGLDGIYAAGPHTIIGVQNGTNPNRVVRIELEGNAVKSVTTVAANLPSMNGGPTLGAMACDRFFFIANGEWELFDDQGTLRAGASPTGPVILEISTK